VPHSDINIIASNADNWYSGDRTSGQRHVPDRDLDGKDDRAEAAGTGAGVGAAVGGAAGLLAGLGIDGDPRRGSGGGCRLAGVHARRCAAGGVAGSVVGALTQAGISKEDADIYAEGLRRGGAVVSARVPDADASRLQAIMDRSAVNVRERAAAYRQAGWQSFNVKESPIRRIRCARSVSSTCGGDHAKTRTSNA
jgi:hypothetical protein